MRILWTLIKVAIGLAIAIPLGLFALGITFGLVGIALAVIFGLLKLAFVGLLAYGVYRVARFFLGGKGPSAPARPVVHELPARDPYYDAAMRELDSELGPSSR